MSKLTINVDPKTGKNYLPRHIREEGFIGKVDVLVNALTITFIRPGTALADVDKSLEIIHRDIGLRIRQSELAHKTEKKVTAVGVPVGKGAIKSGRAHPIFAKYSRDWLSRTTGYSKAYPSRVATGNTSLAKSFVERCSFSLQETESELFIVDDI